MSKLISSVLAVTAVATGAVLTAAPAQARACFTMTELDHVNGFMVGLRSLYCFPPDVEHPLATTIQRKVGSSWVNVTSTGSGGAAYTCVGTSTSTYRLLESPSVQRTAPCS